MINTKYSPLTTKINPETGDVFIQNTISKRMTSEEFLLYTQSLFLSQLLLEHIDVLKDHKYYTKNLKFHLNKAEALLEKEVAEDNKKLYTSEDEATVLEVAKNKEEFIKKFCLLNPKHFGALDKMLDILLLETNTHDKFINQVEVNFKYEE